MGESPVPCITWVAAICAVAACTAAPGPEAVSVPTSGTTRSVAVPAWRHRFPSLSGYAEVGEKWSAKGAFAPGDAAKFSDGTGYLAFQTPDGLNCRMRVGNSGRGDSASEAGCWGQLPATPNGEQEVYAIWGDKSARFLASTDTYAQGRDFRPLGAMQVLTQSGFEGDTAACAVDGQGMTACLLHIGTTDGSHDHGFVLDPKGSWVF